MIADIEGKITGLVNSISSTPGKMKIIPLLKVAPVPGALYPQYEVMFNPENYGVNYEFSYNAEQAIGESAVQQIFNSIKPKKYNFEFMIDGTGATGEKRDVVEDIAKFNEVAGFRGALHRPGVLLLIWGTFYAVTVLEKADIKYTLFDNNGVPLRATISCTFSEFVPKLLQVLRQALQSPDLTTQRTVGGDEPLPLICYKVYDDSRHYLETARANQLTNFRKLQSGIKLNFPPLEKNNKTDV